jgi:hypothetical protein
MRNQIIVVDPVVEDGEMESVLDQLLIAQKMRPILATSLKML